MPESGRVPTCMVFVTGHCDNEGKGLSLEGPVQSPAECICRGWGVGPVQDQPGFAFSQLGYLHASRPQSVRQLLLNVELSSH